MMAPGENDNDDHVIGDTAATSSTASLVDNNVDEMHTAGQPSKRNFIEPVMLILLTFVTLSDTAVPNVVELHYCRAVLKIPHEECFNNTSQYKNQIQTFTSTFGMLKTFTEVFLPATVSICLGSWSDIFGRKPLIMAITVGYFTAYCLWTWLTTIAMLHPLFFVLASVPIGLTGGSPIFIMLMFCYMCDITSIEARAVRLGVLQCLLSLGSLFGGLLCPYISAFNYTAVFGTSAVACYFCLVYVYFWVDESVVCSEEEKQKHSKNPISFQYVNTLFDTCFNKLNTTCQLSILFLTISITFSLTAVLGEISLMYLFMQNILGWNLKEFMVLNSFQVITSVLGTYGVLWLFSRKLKINDLYVMHVVLFLRILGSLVMVFGFKIWHIYLSRSLCAFSSVVDPLIRSFLSKIIPREELGKIFAVIAAGGSLTPLLSSGLYSMIYNATEDTFPGAIFLLSAGILLLTLYILILTYLLHLPPKRSPPQLPININA